MTFPAPVAAQIVRKFDETPKDLPKYSIKNNVSAMPGPATYQGQDCERNSIIDYLNSLIFVKVVNPYLCGVT